MEFRNLKAEEIEVKVKKVSQKGAIALLYKTARTDMDILDETVGAENWTNDYEEIKGNLYCSISIKNEAGEWVSKKDCGIESREDGEGNEKKGEASDAFKRAGFRWGIGRELYTSPVIWISSEAANIQTKPGGNGFVCYDKFKVEKILYSEDGRRITALAIWNETQKRRAYVWQE